MGDSGAGLSGVEYSMQSVLSAQNKTGYASGDSGSNIYLTIDANLQYRLKEIARKTIAETGAESFTLIAGRCKIG